jgi:hypothetical protein
VEAALEAASTHGDFAPFYQLLNIIEHPYDDQPAAVSSSGRRRRPNTYFGRIARLERG